MRENLCFVFGVILLIALSFYGGSNAQYCGPDTDHCILVTRGAKGTQTQFAYWATQNLVGKNIGTGYLYSRAGAPGGGGPHADIGYGNVDMDKTSPQTAVTGTRWPIQGSVDCATVAPTSGLGDANMIGMGQPAQWNTQCLVNP
jgi:hypothetical protein